MDFRCVVIDDEQYAVDALARYIADMPNLILSKTFTSALQALQGISAADDLDFIFLDIEMPEISGLELAETLRSKTRFLVFTTSHSKHALAAYNLDVNQYLLKPISFATFALKINALMNSLEPSRKLSATVKPKGLQFIKADQKNSYHYLDLEQIIFVQAAKNYVHIYTDKESFITHMGLNHMETALSVDHFIRISKSFIIAKNAIRKIEGNSVRLKNGETFQIGESYKANFLAFVKENMSPPK
ncbi:MAG: LytTR family DNA-binding domain-containing protein [Pedobacter sp.]|nr:LytTR family DNA-binding domain-containing protein [Pedobacter sp.]MDQ8054367.1 LytTR family DNA-binding domain-containing protein [Pedobacter sp.]